MTSQRGSVDRVVIISLERRRDRLDRFFRELSNVEWPFQDPQVFRAIDGARVPKPINWTHGDGAWGCLQSHRSVLEAAIQEGCESVLVLEDDACFAPDFGFRLREFFYLVPGDWDGVMLGGQHVAPPYAVGPGIVRCVNCHRTHAYIVRGRMLKDLYRMWISSFGHCDHLMGPFAAGYNVFAPEPFLVGQNDGRSDIVGSFMPTRFWTRKPNGNGSFPTQAMPALDLRAIPVMCLRAPASVALGLSQAGFYFGDRVDPTSGMDRGLLAVMALPDSARGPCLQSWMNHLIWEANSRSSVPAVYHPQIGLDAIKRVGVRSAHEIAAPSADAAICAWTACRTH